jgi:hypothetical protein
MKPLELRSVLLYLGACLVFQSWEDTEWEPLEESGGGMYMHPYLDYVVALNCVERHSYIMPLYSLKQIGRGTQEARGAETAAPEGTRSSKSNQINWWTHETRNKENVTAAHWEQKRFPG